MTRVAFLDPFAGASGDMLLGALLDAGWPLADLQAVVDSLALGQVEVRAERVHKHHLAGTHLTIHAPGAQPLRHPADLLAIVAGAHIAPAVRDRAVAVIERLAAVEARAHGIPVEEVHFHEVGAVDTLVDIVGTLAGFAALGVERIVSAPLPWSRGTVQTEHGLLPVPPPAVAALLEGYPVHGVDVQGEMVTPTGAALVTNLADSFGRMPDMVVQTVAYGAGTRDWPDRANLLRLVLGEAVDGGIAEVETLTVLACNLDDMNPQWYGPLAEAAFHAGALDVWLTPAYMKKSRPGIVVEVLCRPAEVPALREMLFRQTTTLGIRETSVTRWALPRQTRTVQTPYGDVRIKIGDLPGGGSKMAPEHDDCAARAAEHNVSVREVWQAALNAAADSAAPHP